MRTTLMQRMASGVAMSTVLAIGHSASDEERVGATGQAWSRLEGVTLTRVLGADPTGLEIPGEHVSAGPPPAGAVMAVGQRASADEPDAAQAGSRHEGIVLPRVVRADPARLDLRGASASAGLLTRDAGGAQPAWLEAREDRDW